jgi:hypothetical protein
MKSLISLLVLALSLTAPIAIGALEIPEPLYNAVSPISGPLYATEPAVGLENISVYSYNYSLNIDQIKAASKSNDTLYLQIYNPETNNWIDTGINTAVDGKTYPATSEVVEYKVDSMMFGEPFLGLSKYRFVDAEGNALKDASNGNPIEFSGPRIVLNLKDEEFRRDADGTYSYSVLARSENTTPIGLQGTSDKINWTWIGSPIRSSSKSWTKLEWNNASYYKVVEFKVFE